MRKSGLRTIILAIIALFVIGGIGSFAYTKYNEKPAQSKTAEPKKADTVAKKTNKAKKTDKNASDTNDKSGDTSKVKSDDATKNDNNGSSNSSKKVTTPQSSDNKTTTNDGNSSDTSSNNTSNSTTTSGSGVPADLLGDYSDNVTIFAKGISAGTGDSAVMIHSYQQHGNTYTVSGDSMTNDTGYSYKNSYSTPTSGTIVKNADGSITLSGFSNPFLNGNFPKE